MSRTISVTAVFFLLILAVAGQDQGVRRPVSSSVPDTAKYEIVQTNAFLSTSGSTLTFRLDKYTGRIFQLGGCPQKTFIGTGLCWKEMTIIELPKNTGDGLPRYQIFVSGERERNILLMNVVSGQTWQYGVEAADRWTPLLDPIVLPQSFEIIR